MKKKTKSVDEQVNPEANEDRPDLIKVYRKDLLSTGSTSLNLALTGDPFGGMVKGKMLHFVGDSDSGKTFLSMTCMAETQLNKNFKDYRLIYDGTEGGMMIDLDRMFGEAVADRIEPPTKHRKTGEPIYSDTLESFYYHAYDACEAGPCIYVLDSIDVLGAKVDKAKFRQGKERFRKESKAAQLGKELDDDKAKGSYGMAKAKLNSEFMRDLQPMLSKHGSILVIINQSRDNPNNPYNPKTHAGGRALKFYSIAEVWSSPMGDIPKLINGKKRKIGTKCRLKVTKNHITGRKLEVQVDIYPSFGIDDLGGCVDFLVAEKWWSAKRGQIVAKEFGITGKREKVIRLIEKRNLENELRVLTGKCFHDLTDAMTLTRKNKYTSN